jgi:hypothetical protein
MLAFFLAGTIDERFSVLFITAKIKKTDIEAAVAGAAWFVLPCETMKVILLGAVLMLSMSRPGCGGEEPPDLATAQDLKPAPPDMRLPACGPMTGSCGASKYDFSVPTKWGSCRMQVPCTPTMYWQDYERMMVQECTDLATGMPCAKSYWQPMSGCFPMCNK